MFLIVYETHVPTFNHVLAYISSSKTKQILLIEEWNRQMGETRFLNYIVWKIYVSISVSFDLHPHWNVFGIIANLINWQFQIKFYKMKYWNIRAKGRTFFLVTYINWTYDFINVGLLSNWHITKLQRIQFSRISLRFQRRITICCACVIVSEFLVCLFVYHTAQLEE